MTARNHRLALTTMHLRAGGFGATVDGYAADEGELWFLSLLGNRDSLRALWARLVKGEVSYLAVDQYSGGVPRSLATSVRGHTRLHLARLPVSGAHHALLVPEVALYTIDRGGHSWPGGPQYLPQAVIGRVNRDIDASWVIWDFFKRQARE